MIDNISKADIIVQFTQDQFVNEEYDEFFNYNDLGVPIAIALSNGLVNLTEDGEALINETWKDLCELFDADPEEEYESIDDLMD